MGRQLFNRLKSLTTESSNPASQQIDRMPTIDVLRLINAEDHRIADAVAGTLPQIASAVDIVVNSFRSGGRLIYAGAGTSGRLGVLDAAECPPTFGVSPRMVTAVIAGGRQTLVRSREGVEDDIAAAKRDILRLKPTSNDTVIGIAASGRTPYPLAVLAEAKRTRAKTVFLVCNAVTVKPRFVDLMITPVVGPEVLTGSTRMKAGTACKLVLNMISTTAMIQVGKCYGNLMVDLRATSAKLVERSKRILVESLGIDYAAAGRLLKQSRGEVKTAIAMHLLGLDYRSARTELQRADGRLAALVQK